MRGRRVFTVMLFCLLILNIFLFYQEKVEAQEVDYLLIVDTPGTGTSEISDQTVDVGTTITGYAAAFNYSEGYIGDKGTTLWSVINSGGAQASTFPSQDYFSTFNAGPQGGTVTWKATYLYRGVWYNDTVNFTINPPTIDYIQIVDTPDTGADEILDHVVCVGQSITGYAAAFNNSGGYIGDISVSWDVIIPGGANASTSPTSGESSTFYSGFFGGTVTWTADDGSGHTDSIIITILPPDLDYIEIVDTPNTGANLIIDQSVVIGTTIWGYAAGFNDTIGYFGDILVDWYVVNGTGANASTSPPNGKSSQFDAGPDAGQASWYADTKIGLMDCVTFTIIDMGIDYIQIEDAPGGGGSEILDQVVDYGYSIRGYAVAYNDTVGPVGSISVSWSVDNNGSNASTSPVFGIHSEFYSGYTEGTATWIADGGGPTGSVTFIIRSPTVDYIYITDAPNGSPLTNVTLPLWGQLTAYASGYNYTSGYVGLVEVNWTGNGGIWVPETGTNSTFTTGNNTGWFYQIGENITLGLNYTFVIEIVPYPVAYIILTDAPGGAELAIVILASGEQVTAYASGYNSLSGYTGLVEVNWSQAPSLGSFDNLTGTSTTFTAGDSPGQTTITGEDVSKGVIDTFDVIISPPPADYIFLTDLPNGSVLTTVILNVGEQVTAYASGYNVTIGYVGLVNINWSQIPTLGSFDNLTGTSTTFTAGLVGGSTTIMGENTSLGLNDSFEVTINPPTADYILIRTQPGGGGINLCDPVNYQSYPVGATDIYYGALYNHTAGYFADTPGDATWTSSNPSIATVTSPGSYSNITCDDQDWGGPVVITMSASGKENTTEITVLEPTVDYIQIRDEPGGLGNIVTSRIYIVWQVDVFYAAGYNNTADYLGEVEAAWISNDTDVGHVTSPGLWTNFTAQKVDEDSLCHVTAEFNGVTDSTGALTVLAPRIDFITVVDAPGGGGNWVASGTYDEGEKDVFWAAGFNLTADYVKDVNAAWESNNTIVGKVTPGPGESTNFTAGWRGGYCRVTATFNSFTNHTGPLFVINVNQLPTARADHYNGTGFDGGNYTFTTDITLRVTGRKENIITMELEEDGIVMEDVEVTRHSNQPDIGVISYEMDVHAVYEVVLRYNGHNGGSNPVIVTFEFLGNIYSVHLLFNSQHGTEQTARIRFNDVLQLVGTVFLDAFRSADFEGYLVDYSWDFGDGMSGNGETLAHTYEEDGVYTVTLTVTDDEGGTDTDTMTVHVENIDNNDQVNAILGSNASQGYLNGSGQYAVILQCPAYLMIADNEGRQLGLLEDRPINTLEESFVAKLYTDIEVYFIPKDEVYIFKVIGTGIGYYDLSIIGIENGFLTNIRFINVTCTENTMDTYIINFMENRITIISNEENKIYSMDLMASEGDFQDHFYLSDMGLNKDTKHTYIIQDWTKLGSGKPITLSIDEDGDGRIDRDIDLKSGLSGDEVDALLVKSPVSEPVFPFLLFIIAGFICAISVGTLITEVGKWVLISLFLPLYSRIKKEDLLDLPIRYKIHGYLIGKPGAHFGSIKQDLDIPNGQLVYHLKKLMKANLIYSREDGIKKRFYPMDFPKVATDQQFKGTEEMILEVLENNSGANQKEIASSLGVSRQVVGYHLNKMEEKGIINKEVEGRETRYYPSESLHT